MGLWRFLGGLGYGKVLRSEMSILFIELLQVENDFVVIDAGFILYLMDLTVSIFGNKFLVEGLTWRKQFKS